MRSRTTIYLCFAALAPPLAMSCTQWDVGQAVQTTSGLVYGHPAQEANGVSEYLGIPYANPPVGGLRFAAPQAYSANSSINGTSVVSDPSVLRALSNIRAQGFSCPVSPATQIALTPNPAAAVNYTASGIQILDDIAQKGYVFSEDCLTLNVWTKPQMGDTKKAVMVWIYGGAFNIGSTSVPIYNGQYIVDREDVIVVTLNYRVSIFGFPGLEGANNLGLLDQRLAIEWVRDNIAAFGGDTSRITLFGESAGGASVDYYSYAWTADPIVAGFIAESGTVAPATAASSSAIWYNVTSSLGCGDALTPDQGSVLACMRSKDFNEIASAATASFSPTIDGTVVFGDYAARSLAGNFIQKPMLIGFNNNEGLYLKVTNLNVGVDLPNLYYTLGQYVIIMCPIVARAATNVAHKLPTWRYRYFGNFPNMQLTTSFYTGAYHSSEVPILFNEVPSGPGIPPSTQAEIDIGSYLRGAWAAFAKDPVAGLLTYEDGWPQFNPSTDSLVRLGYNNQTGANLVNSFDSDAPCLLL
ncbi:hypothetical protein B7494_g6327 [Chlorociboria aeruginascens]|nr:hypothetical protein B7494_g6327 [Chlorociboria aeruginascens]